MVKLIVGFAVCTMYHKYSTNLFSVQRQLAGPVSIVNSKAVVVEDEAPAAEEELDIAAEKEVEEEAAAADPVAPTAPSETILKSPTVAARQPLVGSQRMQHEE